MSTNKENSTATDDAASWGGNVSGVVVEHHDIQHLEGQILTIIDSAIADSTQREAMKSLIRNAIWEWNNNAYRWAPAVSFSWANSSTGDYKVTELKADTSGMSTGN